MPEIVGHLFCIKKHPPSMLPFGSPGGFIIFDYRKKNSPRDASRNPVGKNPKPPQI